MKRLVSDYLRHLDRRALVYSIVMFSFLFFFERAVFKVNYRHYLLLFHAGGKLLFALFLVAILLSLFGILTFFYIHFVSSWKYRLFYFLLFVLAVFFEYGYQKAFGRFSYFTDLQIASFTNSEQKLSAIGSYFNWIALVPCVVYGFMLLVVRPRSVSHSLRKLIAIAILFVGFYTVFWSIGVAGFSRQYNFPTVSLGAFVRTTTSYVLFRAFAYRGKRETVAAPALANTYRPNNNIVFVVDESIRADHLSLNQYSRATTPFLDQLYREGLIHNWGTAVSASTCSVVSHDLLITGFGVEDLRDANEKINSAPLIFQYAKAMRYKTYYIDGQMDSLWGAMEGDGISYIDDWMGSTSFGTSAKEPWKIDFEIAKRVREITEASGGNFVFVFKRGFHAPNRLTFPPGEETWSPSYVGAAATGATEELSAVANSYDNGIKYNLDRFFQILAPDFHNLPNNTVIIYTGDHGQTLGEDGARHTHCGETRREAAVPLFVIGSLGQEVDVNFKPVHANLFATMLDLMNYPEELRKRAYAVSLLKAKAADSRERFFVSPTTSDATWVPGRMIRFD